MLSLFTNISPSLLVDFKHSILQEALDSVVLCKELCQSCQPDPAINRMAMTLEFRARCGLRTPEKDLLQVESKGSEGEGERSRR